MSLSTYYLENGRQYMLRDSTVVVTVAVVRTRPRAIPLPMITMTKSVRFRFPYLVMGLRLAALRAAGAPLPINSKISG